MQPIQAADTPEVDIELLMMQIMHLGLGGEEIETAVHGGRVEQLPGEKGPEAQDVDVQDLRRETDRQDIGDQMLDRVRVNGRQRHGRREPVMHLVDAAVDARVVQQPVRVVEEHLAHGQAQHEVPRHLGHARQRLLDAIASFTSQRQERDLQPGRDQLVPERDAHAVPHLRRRRLFLHRLELVSLRKRSDRRREVNEEIDGAGEPEGEELHDTRSDQFDRRGGVSGHDVGPAI